MAAEAAHIGLGVRRAVEVGMGPGMATQAGLIHILGRGLGGIENLGYIAAAVDVRFARPMATFAGHAILAVHLGDLGMGVVGRILGDIRMAGRAGLRTHELAGIGLRRRSRGRLVAFGRSSRCRRRQQQRAQQQQETYTQSRTFRRNRRQKQMRNWPIFVHPVPPLVLSLRRSLAVSAVSPGFHQSGKACRPCFGRPPASGARSVWSVTLQAACYVESEPSYGDVRHMPSRAGSS